MDYRSISSEYADLCVKKDYLLINTADSEYQLPLRTISSVSFIKAEDEDHPGSIQCFMVDGTSVSAPFEEDMELIFQDAYAKIAGRLIELKKEPPEFKPNPDHSGSVLAAAALAMGIIALVLSMIPIVYSMAFLPGIAGLVLAVMALLKNAPKEKPVASLVLCTLAMAITLMLKHF
jgi:hypothetical protein